MASNVYVNLGYRSFKNFLFEYLLPLLGITILFSVIFYFEPSIPNVFSMVILILGSLFVLIYPFFMYYHRDVEITEYMHFFITYTSALSNLQITKAQIFKKVAEFRRFGYISDISEKLVYFLKEWNITFPDTIRKLSQIVPSKMFKDFLDRLATVSDFGEDIEVFLDEEQVSVMNDLENEYNRTFESIKTIQEVFVSLIITIAFMMAISMLMPLMGTTISFEGILKIGVLVVFILDAAIVLLVWAIIPRDPMFHSLDIKDDDTKKVGQVFMIAAPFTVFILMFIGLSMVDKLPFLLTIALGVSPLMLPAFYAMEAENKVNDRDKAFPTFIRTFGEALETKGGAVLSTTEGLRVHFFGALNPMFDRLYRRLKFGSEKYLSWLYFCGESGSNLIYNFIQIFVESVYLGANAGKVSHHISRNFTKLLNLRKLKFQLASQLRGSFYGALVGFTITTYISASITEKLSGLFSSSGDFSSLGDFESIVGSLIPNIPEIDMFLVSTLIGIMVLIHALASSFTIKIIEGGNKIALFFDFIIMLWMGAFISAIIPIVMDALIPSM